MPNYGPTGWDDDQMDWDASSFYDSDDSFSVWKPGDPEQPYGLSMPERRQYNDALSDMIELLSPSVAAFGDALGPSGYGADYRGASLGWKKKGNYDPKGRIDLGVWGYNRGLADPFPVLGGAIITPTIDIYTKDRDQQYDEYGRALDEREYRTSSGLVTGRAEVASIMQQAGEWGQKRFNYYVSQGMSTENARMEADRAARGSVRSQISSFPRQDFGEKWSWPFGLREAMKGAANIRLHGDYGVGPRDLFQQLGQYGGGYFTRSTSPSEDEFHPERGSWEAYSLDSLYALGWFKDANGGGFITGTNKPDKRRQLGVQRLASPMGADDLMRTGRLTGDRMLNTTAVFLENYAYSEGSGVVDPGLVTGFRDFRPHSIERPAMAGEDWKVRFSSGKNMSGLSKFIPFGNKPGDFGAAGESVFLGEQFINGEWQSLGEESGTPGVQQRLYGYRKTKAGYQALIESISPFESGTAKLMHHGMKALLFQSSGIIGRMQQTVALAQAAGRLPGDVQAPRMVLPMSKDWIQTYRGMFDFMDENTLRGMGISDSVIQSKDWQKVGPGVVDKMHKYVQDRRFTFDQQYEIPVDRLGAFENAGNIVGGKNAVEYLTKGGVNYARFTAQHTGYALPIAAGIRMEYPGHSPMYSPEEMMQLKRLYPQLADRLASKANPASRIWGAAVAAAEGVVPEGAISHEDLPWMTARLGMDGGFDDEGSARKLVQNLAKEMQEKKQLGAIMGPGGVLMPNPVDVMSQSIMGYTGQEQSQFVSSYIRAMKLMGTGEDATKALAEFSGHLQTFASGHNVRRKALGAMLDRAVEGTFTSHLAIPDDVVVAGNESFRTLLGIRADDKDADAKFAEAIRMLEKGENFYAIGTRRPISDMFNQLGTPTRVITEKMAQEMYGVEIENLGRSFAVSPTLAAVWRGDVDADRALLHGVTNVSYKGTEMHMPQGVDNETWYVGGVSFKTSDEILGAFNEQTMMARQVAALRARAPEAFGEWMTGTSKKTRGLVEAGLGGDRGIEATRALSQALHGIPVDWNESAKWSEELATGTGKNLPQNFAYYANPDNGTVFSREAMLGKFEQTAKSKMLMGRGYNRYLRGLTSLARDENELQASVTLASNVYQKALDNQKMTKGELMLFNMMESMGPSGAVYDKFYKEQGYVGGGSAFTGGPAGMIALMASSITDMDVPREAMATLFSRDPEIARVVAGGGNALDILTAISNGGRQYQGAINFLEDPERAGILPQLIQSLHYSKEKIEPRGAAQRAYAAQGQSIRDLVDVVGRSYKQRTTSEEGKEIEVGGLMAGTAADKMRNMAGLDSLSWWKRSMAKRMGLNGMFFASDNEVMARMPSFANPALSGEEFPAFISQKEADVLEGLRQMPISQAQQIAAAIGQPARYTPKGGAPSFDTGPDGWDKFNQDQQNELKRMLRHGAADSDITARMKQFLDQMENGPAPDPGSASPFDPYDPDIFGNNPPTQEEAQLADNARVRRYPSKKAREMPRAPIGLSSPEQVEFAQKLKNSIAGGPVEGAHAAIIEHFANRLIAGQDVDMTPAPWLMPYLQDMALPGTKAEMFVRSYGRDNYQIRASFTPQGLKGNALTLLERIVNQGSREGYTPEVLGDIEKGYQHEGLGQGMMRAVRGFLDADIGSMDAKGLWQTWDHAQKIKGAMGQDFPMSDESPAGAKMEELSKRLSELTEVQKEHLKISRDQLQADPRYGKAEAFLANLALKPAAPLSRDEQDNIKALLNLRKGANLPTDDIEQIISRSNQEANLRQFGEPGSGEGGGGLRSWFNENFGGGGDRRKAQGGLFAGSLGALNFGMWGAQMWWKWTGKPVLDWTQEYAGQQMEAAQAAYLTGASVGGIGDAPQELLKRQALIKNTTWQLGQAAYNVWGQPVTNLVEGIANAPEGRQEAVVTALGAAGLIGVGQLGATTLGMMTGLPGIGALGPIRLAGAGIRGLTGLATKGLTGLGMELLTNPVTAGLAGGIASALGPIGALTGAGFALGSGAPPGLTQATWDNAPDDAARQALSQAMERNLLIQGNLPDWKMSEMYGQNWQSMPFYDISSGTPRRQGGDPRLSKADAWRAFQAEQQWYNGSSVLELYGGGDTGSTGAPRATGMTPSQVTDLAKTGEKIGISIEEGTIVIQRLAGLTGEAVSEDLFQRAATQSRMHPGGITGLLSGYSDLMQRSQAIPGTPGISSFLDNLVGLNETQVSQYQAALGIVGQYSSSSWGMQDFWSQAQQVQGQIAQGTPLGEISTNFGASMGKLGLASAMSIPKGSPIAVDFEQGLIGGGSPLIATNQVEPFAEMLGRNFGSFQHLTGKQKAALGPELAGLFQGKWAGELSDYSVGRGVEQLTGSTPWGYSAQRDFGPGSLTDSLGRQYGMYEPWTATAGRQAGQSFAPLFDLQMNAAYASLGAQSAALPIEHRTFLRQQAAQRMQWGSGPFVEQSKVQAAIFPDPGSGVEPAQVGTGMQIGESSIGLVQQEAAIRKQMWQENLAYQQQSIGFQRQSLSIAREELELSKQQYTAQREYNLSERGANRGMQMRQREWAAEDFSIRMERMGTTQGWAMEDLQRARRYSTGRERVDIERNIQRTMLSQSWERDDANRGRNREQEVQRFQDQRYDAAIKFEQKLHELQMQKFGLQEQKLGLQEAMLNAQEAHLNNQAALQEKLNKIDEDRFKFQYDQTQAQMKDDEALEKIRQDVRKAEIAFQTAQLANAETLQQSQEDWQKKLEEGKTNGVLDKWIEFFNSVRAGPPGYIPPAEPTGGIDPTGGQHAPSGAVKSSSRYTEMGIGRELTRSSQPTVVNFVLDGEVIMQAVVKPERLRPVVEEINRRGKLR